MDRGNAKHGPQRDEVLAQEVRDYVRAGRETHTADWRTPEPLTDEVSADVDRGDGMGLGSAPRGMSLSDVEERSELARWLGRAVFPADRDEVVDHLQQRNAPDHVVAVLRHAPKRGQFASVGELWRAMHSGAHVEKTR
jgi:hypothetical protein